VNSKYLNKASKMQYIVSGLSLIGLDSPISRTIFGATAGFVLQLLLKPSISYNEQGNTKTFALFADKDDKDTTYFPWYLFPILLGLLMGVFL
jgi:hypothetical protein